jgi:homoserine O-succinyltransferase
MGIDGNKRLSLAEMSLAYRSPREESWPSRDDESGEVVVAIVNNMSDGGFRSTEKQFVRLLSDAAGAVRLRVQIFCPAELLNVDARHFLPEDVWESKLDGLIVTGAEPQSFSLIDEPCWRFLGPLVDWADENTGSTIWSCLAAHAAVYRLDGIVRRDVGTKLFGVFECEQVEEHAILDECPSQWRLPHSRYNDLPEAALVARGYRILTRSSAAGVDTFVKQRNALHLFMQGHLEYDADALLREYRRDVRRFLTRERHRYPEIPRGYLGEDVVAELVTFREKALQNRSAELLAEFPPMMSSSEAPWREVAVRFYRNWLTYLANRKRSASDSNARRQPH